MGSADLRNGPFFQHTELQRGMERASTKQIQSCILIAILKQLVDLSTPEAGRLPRKQKLRNFVAVMTCAKAPFSELCSNF